MNQLEELLQQCTVKLTLPGGIGWGTGFFVAPEWILTCAHVVKAANSKPVQVRWLHQENWTQAVVTRSLLPPYDLALLRVTLPKGDSPPCVYLDAEIQSRDPLYLFGYPDTDVGFPNGCPVTFSCEGLTGDEPALIKFALGQVRPGMSGSPLLNQRTGKVCGLVKFTRDRSIDLGGGAVPTAVILAQLPELVEQQQDFHQRDLRWVQILKAATTKSDMSSASNAPIEVFFSYSHRDEQLRSELEKHLSILKRQGIITAWYDREISAGTEWAGKIDEHLNTAQIILLLISADFLASNYCYDIELKRAMERDAAREARVIPVILRDVYWKGAPFGKLQALPKNAEPVTNWANQDQAFKDVAIGIHKAVEELTSKK